MWVYALIPCICTNREPLLLIEHSYMPPEVREAVQLPIMLSRKIYLWKTEPSHETDHFKALVRQRPKGPDMPVVKNLVFYRAALLPAEYKCVTLIDETKSIIPQ